MVGTAQNQKEICKLTDPLTNRPYKERKSTTLTFPTRKRKISESKDLYVKADTPLNKTKCIGCSYLLDIRRTPHAKRYKGASPQE